jgi:lipopolysaccharide biosynthesis glycosyltransferase
MNIVFLQVGNDVIHAEKMVKSARKACKNAQIIQLSDEHTQIVKDVDKVVRKPYNGKLMLFRMQHLADLRGEWVNLDTDIIVKKDLADVFNLEFDVALTKRESSIVDTRGFDITTIMPYNAGVIFSRNHQFWIDALKSIESMNVSLQEWYGDQVAIKLVADTNHYEILELPCDVYNYTPKNAEERKDVYVYHFKGQRKDWMMNQEY